MSLSYKQRMFVEQYLISWNATDAARKAGYSRRTAHAKGATLRDKPEIAALIAERIQAAAMDADEVLARLSEQARANIRDFIHIDPDGAFITLDEEALRTRGHLVKKISTSQGKTSSVSIELYDGQAALVQLGKHLKLFTENLDLTSGGQPIVVKLIDDDRSSD